MKVEAITMQKILQEIVNERLKQNQKWGEQNHPSLHPLAPQDNPADICEKWLGIPIEGRIKRWVDDQAKNNLSNWSAIALGEFVECVVAPNDYERRSELVQLAAVIVQWIECLDRNNRCIAPEIPKFTDESIMPFGKHKGEKMANIPASYLLWLYEDSGFLADGLLKDYIKENLEDLKKERYN